MSRSGARSRQRIIAGAADLIRRRGLAASTVRDLAAHARAPLGSTYHYFPRGKQQLAAEAVRYAGDMVLLALDRELRAGPVAGLRSFLAMWREILISTGFRAGCPVLAVAIEEPPATGDPEAITASAEVFAAWQGMFATSLREHGVTEARARRLATLVIAAIEGAIAVCRASGDIRPLDDTGTELAALVTAATTS